MSFQLGRPNYSVLMSVYKRENPVYLKQALDSIMNQAHQSNDIVIVCDGPLTTELDSILQAYAASNESVIRLLRLKENVGLGSALNEGLKVCRNEYVMRMDSDDISVPSRSEMLMDAVARYGYDLVGGAIEEFDQTPGDLGQVRETPIQQSEIERIAKRKNPFNHVSVVFSKHAVERAGGYKPFYLMEDYYLWVRMLMNGIKCANLNQVLVHVRVGNGMYERRGGEEYVKAQKEFFCELHQMGFITRLEMVRAISERTVASLMPAGVRRIAYEKLLRKTSKQ